VEMLAGLFVIIFLIMLVSAFLTRNGERIPDWDSERSYKQQSSFVTSWLANRAENAELAEMICGPLPVGLDWNERAVFVLPGVLLFEPRAVRYSRRAYGGSLFGLLTVCHFALAPIWAKARAGMNCASLMRALWC
jgi:hypothetical protein